MEEQLCKGAGKNKNRKMIEYEIQKLKDLASSLESEEADIVFRVLAKDKVDQVCALRTEICDKYCRYPNICREQDELDEQCEACEVARMCDTLLGL